MFFYVFAPTDLFNFPVNFYKLSDIKLQLYSSSTCNICKKFTCQASVSHRIDSQEGNVQADKATVSTLYIE